MKHAVVLLVASLLLCCASAPSYEKTLKVTSVFENGGEIPTKYTCDGDDISPYIKIEGVKSNVKSFAIICEDPDAPMGTFTHWIAWNVKSTEIPENIPKVSELTQPVVMRQGKNDFGKVGYNGPCPPPGKPHRYFFKVYALDATLDGEYDKKSLIEAMEGHIVQYGEIYGVYQR
jgi:hypothetical protein